ncbi:hypothetical protein [Spirochaeta africana]|uniref:Uncharacterized protein n=1 Tax=Spirochaeta africana (strain ATCC 700263 / DSM 8902 / Z-7692) TaxID=889378 RepID=H9UJV4_SPIAZ|nr:hypothetical protein [Spirochaeta africana]AFG37797.1 hypothetical protein Spiaf_1740 [Spirochaeta africana DSM 8902]
MIDRKEIEDLLQQGSFLPAILALQEGSLDPAERQMLLGSAADRIVAELDGLKREERERRIYLRSLLQMVFRQVPGLAAVYRDQVRAVHGGDPVQTLYKNFKTWSDVASGHKSVRDGVDDTAESVRQGFEDAGESMRSGEFSENLKGFFDLAEQGFKAGLKSIDDALQGRTPAGGSPRSSQERPPQPEDPAADDDQETVRNVHVEVEDD